MTFMYRHNHILFESDADFNTLEEFLNVLPVVKAICTEFEETLFKSLLCSSFAFDWPFPNLVLYDCCCYAMLDYVWMQLDQVPQKEKKNCNLGR